jgi:pimeloyl-ACP methyl ester carboxylesterase
MRFVFLHGGPGFNSHAEQAILGPLFQAAGLDVEFWNEPSRLRPDGDRFEVDDAFERWLASATAFVLRSASSGAVNVLAHSCGVHAAVQIAGEHPQLVASLTLITPSADNAMTFRNVLRIAGADLAEVNPDLAARINTALAHTRAVFDAAMRDGLMAAVQDDRLFAHYFADAGQLQLSAAAWSPPEAQFDLESFLAVLTGFGRRGGSLLSESRVAVPALALYGAQDPITPMSEQVAALRTALPDCRVELVEGCSHCLHLDRPRHFVERVLDWTASLEATQR